MTMRKMLAGVAVWGMAAVCLAGGTKGWEAGFARPEMPGRRTLEAWREGQGKASARRSAKEKRAEFRKVAEEALGFPLPEGTVWEPVSVGEAERLEVASFSDGAGRANRIAVYEQIGNRTPLYWLVEGEGAAELAEELAEKAGAVWNLPGVLEASETEVWDRLAGRVEAPFGRFRLRFLDDAPGADWIRPCRWLFEDAEGRGFAVLWKRLPPGVYRAGSDDALGWTAAEKASAAGAEALLEAATATAREYARRLRDRRGRDAKGDQGIDFAKGHPELSHFVLFSGGGGTESNYIRYWCDTAMLYSTLTLKYGVPKDHIHVFVSDGTSPDEDANLNIFATNLVAVSSPQDLDGDGEGDIDGPASREAVSNCFANLAQTLGAADQLWVFATGHGTTTGVAATNNFSTEILLWTTNKQHETFTDAEFASWTEDIRCPMVVALEPCFTGGFVDDVVAQKNRVIATAPEHFEVSYGNGKSNLGKWSDGTGGNGSGTPGKTKSANYWAQHFIGALRGVYPANLSTEAFPWEDGDTVTDADTNGDRCVSFAEAATYARLHDPAACQREEHSWGGVYRCLQVYDAVWQVYNTYEHPQYGESEEGLGERMSVLRGPGYLGVDPHRGVIPTAGTTGVFRVTSDGGWRFVVAGSTVEFPGAMEGTGDGTVPYTIPANPGTAPREHFIELVSRSGAPTVVLRFTQPGTGPGNDAFAAAQGLGEGMNGWVWSNVNASLEEGEPLPAFREKATGSIWWSWTAGADGRVMFSTKGSEAAGGTNAMDTVLGVYTGSSAGALVAVAENDDIGGGKVASEVRFDAVKGTTYRICASGKDHGEGSIRLTWGYEAFRVEFDANDGSGWRSNRVVAAGQAIGELPEPPAREEWKFAGWRTGWAGGLVLVPERKVDNSFTCHAWWRPRNDDLADAQAIFNSVSSGTVTGNNTGATVEEAEIMWQDYPEAAHSVWWKWTAPRSGGVAFETAGSEKSPGVGLDTVLGVYRVLPGDKGVVVLRVAENDDTGGTRQSRVEIEATDGEVLWVCVAGCTEDDFGSVRLAWHYLLDVTLDGNGGSVMGGGSNAVVHAESGEAIGAERLESWTAERRGYAFDGWRWQDGKLSLPVTAALFFTNDVTLKAAWRARPANDAYIAAANLGDAPEGSAAGTTVDATQELGEPLGYHVNGPASVWWRWTPPFAGRVWFDCAGSTNAAGEELDTVLSVSGGFPAAESPSNAVEIAFCDDWWSRRTSRVAFGTDGGGERLGIAVATKGGAEEGSVRLAWGYESVWVGFEAGGSGVLLATNRALLPYGTALGIAELAEGMGFYIQAYPGRNYYCNEVCEYTLRYASYIHVDAIPVHMPVTEWMREHPSGMQKLLLIDTPEGATRAQAALREAFPAGAGFLKSKPHYIE
ncbi:MAG: BACON domain-containing protein, partial [Kiritimatiellae bacterium]|nr:BACON domain-containing protein [Kiritimatiellia bacterium]